MATNSIGDFIKSIFPSLINKDGQIFKALLTDGEGEGTTEKVFLELEDARKEWTEHKNIYDQVGEQLEKTLSVFSVLTRLKNESESAYLKRNELLFYRNGATVWGDKWNILDIFKTFFNNQNVYIVNNTESFADNLLVDGNFERMQGWTLEDCEYEREARFEETLGVFFNAAGTCYQQVEVEANRTYFLHFFLKGNIKLKIFDNNNRYWKPSLGDFGGWNTEEYLMSFNSEEWNNKSVFFITDESVTSVTIQFVYAPGFYAFLDYVRLNLKTRASTFSLIAVFEGVASDETASLAPFRDDPVKAYNFENTGYFSEGEQDVDRINYDNLNYFDSTKIVEDVSPVLMEGSQDIEPLEGYDGMTYLDETKSLAANFTPGITVNYEKMTYFDNAYLFGATSKEAEQIYKELLEIVQPAGVMSTIEILTREQNE